MERLDKIKAAKKHIAEKIGDIIEKNFDEAGGALETAGTFTALLEAYRAVEIAEDNAPKKAPSGPLYGTQTGA